MAPVISDLSGPSAAHLRQLVERLHASLDLELAGILVSDGEGGLSGPCAPVAESAPLIEPLRPLLRHVMDHAAPELQPDAAELPGRAVALMPLAVPEHRPLGCLVAVRSAGAWSPAERAALEGIAAAAAAELRRRWEVEVRQASERRSDMLEQALELVPVGVTITDEQGRIVFTNPAEARMHGYRVEDLYGRSAHTLAPAELHAPPSVPRVRRWVRERTNLRSDGSEFPVRLWSDPLLLGDREVGLVTACADLSPDPEDPGFRAIVENAAELIARFDAEGRLLYLNPAGERLLGTATPDCRGCTMAELAARHELVLPWTAQLPDGEDETCGDGEMRVQGSGRWLRYRVLRLPNPGDGVIIFASDITEHRTRERRLMDDAERDPLTGLLNRDAFLAHLRRACSPQADSGSFALLFLDLDRFKPVNDRWGHAAGDAMLVAVAERMRSGVRPVDLVGRLGGDEFAVLLYGAHTEGDAVSVVERLQRLLAVPVQLSGHELRISASIGIALASCADRAEAVLRSADRAMYRAKAIGPGHFGILDSELAVHEEAVLDAKKALRLAIERDQLVVHYQPIVALEGGRLVGMEALVRWEHPQRGLLGPQAFLPIAEETGLIVELDRWVLRAALRQVRLWLDAGHAVLESPVSVNFSGRHVTRPGAADFVDEALREAGVPAGCLMIEVTETSVMEDRESAAEVLSALRRLGVRVGLDDFGTGYSSLAYLRQFPFDVLKVDRSFVQRIDASEADRAIVRSILALARTLGLEVTAEGVETRRQRAVLRRMGCVQAQGFLLAHPAPAADLEGWFPALSVSGGA